MMIHSAIRLNGNGKFSNQKSLVMKCFGKKKSDFVENRNRKNVVKNLWRREQGSNLHRLTPGSFQDFCTTIMRSLRNGLQIENIPQIAIIIKLSVTEKLSFAGFN